MNKLKYCCYCGKELVLKTLSDRSKEKYCPECDYVFFDSAYPTVIVAVINNDRVLLTDKGLIAGYVKSEETAEDAAIREVCEEVGLGIFNLKFLKTYVAKRHLHNRLMIGFRAETKDLRIKKSKELEKAAWFKLDEPMPLRPDSIAGKMVKEIFPRARLIKPEKKSC